MGQVRFAREETHERSALAGSRVAERPAQRRIALLECVEYGSLGGYGLHLYLAVTVRKLTQMCG